MFTHVVFFKLKESSDQNLARAKELLLSMDGNIKELKGLEVGIDTVKSDRSFDVCLITRFDSKEDYETYAISDYHVNHVIANLKPILEMSKTVDYEN